MSAALGFVNPGRRPRILPRLAEASAIVAILVAAVSAGLLILHGSGDSRLIGLHGVGLSVRLDAVSVVMFLLVSFIGWVVVRYAASYLDGEARQTASPFHSQNERRRDGCRTNGAISAGGK